MDEKSLDLMAPPESYVVVKSVDQAKQPTKEKSKVEKLRKLIWKPKNVLQEKVNISVIEERSEEEQIPEIDDQSPTVSPNDS